MIKMVVAQPALVFGAFKAQGRERFALAVDVNAQWLTGIRRGAAQRMRTGVKDNQRIHREAQRDTGPRFSLANQRQFAVLISGDMGNRSCRTGVR